MESQALFSPLSAQASTHPSMPSAQPSAHSSLAGPPAEHGLRSVPTYRQDATSHYTYDVGSTNLELDSPWNTPRTLPPMPQGELRTPPNPLTESQNTKAPALTDADWDVVRPHMEKLYPTHTKEQVKEKIEEKFGFTASSVIPSQCL